MAMVSPLPESLFPPPGLLFAVSPLTHLEPGLGPLHSSASASDTQPAVMYGQEWESGLRLDSFKGQSMSRVEGRRKESRKASKRRRHHTRI